MATEYPLDIISLQHRATPYRATVLGSEMLFIDKLLRFRQRTSTRKPEVIISSANGKAARCKGGVPVREGGWNDTCCLTEATSPSGV